MVMFNKTRTRWIFLFAVILATPVFAATDPTSEQVYEAARSGHLAQAEQMVTQVLRDHPKSAKAHYVAAEVYAKEGKTSDARHDLDVAQTLAPGLPFAKPEAVATLQRTLAHGAANAPATRYFQPRSPIPWGTLAWMMGGIAILWLIFRKRSEPRTYPLYPPPPLSSPGAPAGIGGMSGAPNAGGAMSFGSGLGSGVGSGIASGLASGLAVGAGVVAGEELAHHFMDGGRNEPNVLPSPSPPEPTAYADTNDMGGNDFGLFTDSSWDDDPGVVSSGVSDDDWI
jgi:hypothetical protein